MKFTILLIRICLLLTAIFVLASSKTEARELPTENRIFAFNPLMNDTNSATRNFFLDSKRKCLK